VPIIKLAQEHYYLGILSFIIVLYKQTTIIMKKGLNIQVTDSQYDFLYDLVMSAYDLDIPTQKGWDMQTFDNLVDNVCNAKQTYLTNDVRGV
jgi:hypothetical protein